MTYPSLAIIVDSQHKESGVALSDRLKIPLNPQDLTAVDTILTFNAGKLSLLPYPVKGVKPITVDFPLQRFKHNNPKDSLLAKAIGVSKKNRPVVIDATAGFAVDAVELFSYGCQMTLIERSPLMFALLEDGLRRSGLLNRVKLLEGDSSIILKNKEISVKDEVIYIDPMFPVRSKQALPKKEMQLLRKLIGDDEDAVHLLENALKCGARRVVLKRRRTDPTLFVDALHFSVEGKSVRFDVYGQ